MSAAPFTWKVRVYYEDTDAGGVVYYANYLRYFERARTELLRAAGVDRALMAAQSNTGFVVHRAQVEYRRPARLDDDLLVSTSIVHLAAASADFSQTVLRHGNVLCEAKISIVHVQFDGPKTQRMPQHLVTALRPFVQAYSDPL